MEPGQSRLCPRCGTPRVGNFRYCRSCQLDFDAASVSAETAPRPFELAPPGEITQSPHVIPAAVTPPAADTSSVRPSTRGRERRPVPPLVVVAVVAVVSLAAIGILSVILPEAASITAGPPGAPSSAAAPVSGPPGSQPPAAPTPVSNTTTTGHGPGGVEFQFADSTGLATITNDGIGPFAVWTVGANGNRGDQIVDAEGAYVGTRRFAATDGKAAFDVESDGAWTIEVKPANQARTWNGAELLVGDGDDVILVFPQPTSDVRVTVVADGAITLAVYAGGSKRELVDQAGPFRGEVTIPAGTSLLEISADAGWSVRPG